ncbi:branched-chain amino acid aminotransferase [Belnapia sp. T6]|uniref:Probable branched-chain-amino-acid aminotransferase n=1 Tax=Belnapia mucosa TaxID=2804532 RepID=A0ABS1V708_9PROT|nr:branched-chain amino acid aminotransferase [Belnapia mucosa]MBL6456514.1 branched-chain amino acid aminotransferase [Belnapia mucosa]
MDGEASVFVQDAAAPRRPEAERQAALRDPGFGRVFTDHMATLRYTPDRGWHDGRIEAAAPLSLHPAAMALQYAQLVFEGMKAYGLPDGGAALFRPAENARRMQRSAARMGIEPVPEALFLEGVRSLVRADRDWIPRQEGASLYLRPFLMGTDPSFAVRPGRDYMFCVIASPAAPIFGSTTKPLTLWISDTLTRAAPGGTGAAKCAGSYGASLQAVAEAGREGCDQAIFLDAVERRWIEELGGMNIMFVFADGSLRTPPLGGTILPGVTRDSLLILARDMGLTVREEPYAIDQWQEDARSGRLTEAFACGTAAVVAPVGQVRGRRHEFAIGGGQAGQVTERLRTALIEIQRGRAPDPHGWVDRLF